MCVLSKYDVYRNGIRRMNQPYLSITRLEIGIKPQNSNLFDRLTILGHKDTHKSWKMPYIQRIFFIFAPDKLLRMNLQPNQIPYKIPQPNNMGLVRYVLAISVLIGHFNFIFSTDFYLPVSSYNAVGCFFALSGFLVTNSWLKHPKWRPFLKNRCIRLLPAYCATVILFAIILYFFSSDVHYFTSLQFWKYIAANLSFMNFIEPDLPGVFTSNTMTCVNGSLWTMKVEWMLYFTTPFAILALCSWKKRPIVIFVSIYLVSMIYRLTFIWLYISTNAEIYNILSRQFIGQLMYFYSGMLIYFYFDVFMRLKWWILPISLILVHSLHNLQIFNLTIEPFVISLLVIWFSMVGRWGTWLQHHNISYIIYLVHFPILQICKQYMPADNSKLSTLLIAIMLSALIGFIIHVLIELPLQKRLLLAKNIY